MCTEPGKQITKFSSTAKKLYTINGHKECLDHMLKAEITLQLQMDGRVTVVQQGAVVKS